MILSLCDEQRGLLAIFWTRSLNLNDESFRAGLAWQGAGTGHPSLGGEGSLWVNTSAFQCERTLTEVNSKFLVINLPNFLPKQFSGFPHSFNAILPSGIFRGADTASQLNFMAELCWRRERGQTHGPQDFCFCFSLWSSLLQRPLRLIRCFSVKFNGFWVRNHLADVWALITGHRWFPVELWYNRSHL